MNALSIEDIAIITMTDAELHRHADAACMMELAPVDQEIPAVTAQATAEELAQKLAQKQATRNWEIVGQAVAMASL